MFWDIFHQFWEDLFFQESHLLCLLFLQFLNYFGVDLIDGVDYLFGLAEEQIFDEFKLILNCIDRDQTDVGVGFMGFLALLLADGWILMAVFVCLKADDAMKALDICWGLHERY